MNWVVAILTAPIGFFIGLFASWAVELASLGQWILAVIAVIFFVFLFFFDWITDKIFDPVFNRIFPEPEQSKEEKRSERHRSTIAFAVGFALAVLSSWIWSAEIIIELI